MPEEGGFSLVELMIAMAIGSILATALLIIFSKVMESSREQFKAAQQIENGRYAIDLMTNDMRMAGYYGEFTGQLPAPAALPDPCAIPAEATITEATANSPFSLHVQGYAAADFATRPTVPAACSGWLDSDTLRPGSDIVVIRRLDTKPLVDPPTTTSATPKDGEIYAQTDASDMDIQYGIAEEIDKTKNAKTADTTLCRKDFSQDVNGTSAANCIPANPATSRPRTAAYIRKVHVHIYFVANCRDSDSDGTCPASNDGIPTLKRLELTADGSGGQTMKIVPLVEGIEFLKVRYGLDTSSHIAGQTLDGSVDSLVPASSVTLDHWQDVVMLELRILARNSEATSNYADDKTYDLGTGTAYAPSGANARYKRHAYTSQIYILNIGGRRES